jgi:hypothetical protein
LEVGIGAILLIKIAMYFVYGSSLYFLGGDGSIGMAIAHVGE